jgi:hypothetical protein
MLVYRFKMVAQEHEEFSMEIEIQPGQTFRDFHVCIIESVELPPPERASFYLTDKQFRRGTELSLKSYKKQVRKYDEEMDEMVTITVTPKLMKDARIKNYIEDPHQRMVYEYIGKSAYSFQVELFRIIQVDGMQYFPRCTRKSGELPKKTTPPVIPEPAKQEPPKVEIPKIPLPSDADLSKLDDIVENEEDLALIDQQIGNMVEEDIRGEFKEETGEGVGEPEEGGAGFEGEEQEGELDHLEDYDDIEHIEMKYSRYEDQDDN